MDIPSLSMAMAQNKVLQDVSIAVMATSLDTARETGAQMVDMMEKSAMELSVNPHIGGNFDVSV